MWPLQIGIAVPDPVEYPEEHPVEPSILVHEVVTELLRAHGEQVDLRRDRPLELALPGECLRVDSERERLHHFSQLQVEVLRQLRICV